MTERMIDLAEKHGDLGEFQSEPFSLAHVLKRPRWRKWAWRIVGIAAGAGLAFVIARVGYWIFS
jgi:hypothetical protein